MFPPNNSWKTRNGFMIFFELISLLIWVDLSPLCQLSMQSEKESAEFYQQLWTQNFWTFFSLKYFFFFVWVRKMKERVDCQICFLTKKIHYFSCKCRSSEVFSFLLSSVVYVFFYIEKYFRYFSINTFVSQCLLNHLKKTS